MQIGDIVLREAGDCWTWEGTFSAHRPVIARHGKQEQVHRVVWAILRGRLSRNLQLRQRCATKGCCRPDHYEVRRTMRGTVRRWSRGPSEPWFRATEAGCWEWTGACTSWGYGWFMLDGKKALTHRRIAQLYYGNIGRLHVLHRCDNPPCCNPDHLRPGTSKQNARDMASKLRGPNKLTHEQADEIRRLRQAEHVSQRTLGIRFGVTHKSIGRILRGETYLRAYAPTPQDMETPELGGRHKLSYEQADEIRRLRATEHLSMRNLARRFDVTHKSISRLLRGETYQRP